jgi:hypothetical protein
MRLGVLQCRLDAEGETTLLLQPGIESRFLVSRASHFVVMLTKLQCVRKVAVHLGYSSDLYRRSWTSVPTRFISAQRLSERRSAESVC